MQTLTFFQSPTSQQEFQLKGNDVTNMVMKFHPDQQTVRISHDGVKRLYFFEQSGNNKVVIRNEYGLKVGNIRYDRWFHSNGTIELEGKKFRHEVHTDDGELILFDRQKHNPLVKCSIMTKTIISQVHAALMLTLCKYLLLPDLKEMIAR